MLGTTTRNINVQSRFNPELSLLNPKLSTVNTTLSNGAASDISNEFPENKASQKTARRNFVIPPNSNITVASPTKSHCSDSGLGMSEGEEELHGEEEDLLQGMTQPELDKLYADDDITDPVEIEPESANINSNNNNAPSAVVDKKPVSPLAPRRADNRLDIAKLPLKIIEAVVLRTTSVADRVSCVLVNKHWSVGATRIIYRNPPIQSLDKFHRLMAVLMDPLSSQPYSGMVTQLNIIPALSEELFMGDIDVALQLFPQLQSFTLTNSPTASNVLVQSLSDHSHSLRSICLRETPITDICVPELIRKCPGLEYVDFSHTSVTMFSLKQLVDKCDRIRKIDLENCGPWLKPILVDQHGIPPRPLKFLNLKNSGVHDTLLRYVVVRCPDIENISIEGCSAITDDGLLKVSFVATEIKKLDCSFCPQISDLPMRSFAAHCKKLETIIISGCDLVSPEAAVHLAESCPKLNDLVMHGCSKILPSYVRDYSLRHYDMDCAVHGAAIGWLAGHKQMQVIQGKSNQSVMQFNQMTQTDTVENIPTAEKSEKTVPDQQPGMPKDATDVIMKLAEAIAEGKWKPPEQWYAGHRTSTTSTVHSESRDSWDSARTKTSAIPEKRWNDVRSDASTASSKGIPIPTGRKPIMSGLPPPTPRSTLNRTSSIPGPKATTPSMIAPPSPTVSRGLNTSRLTTPSKISVPVTRHPTSITSPKQTAEETYKPRRFKRFNDDGLGVVSNRFSSKPNTISTASTTTTTSIQPLTASTPTTPKSSLMRPNFSKPTPPSTSRVSVPSPKQTPTPSMKTRTTLPSTTQFDESLKKTDSFLAKLKNASPVTVPSRTLSNASNKSNVSDKRTSSSSTSSSSSERLRTSSPFVPSGSDNLWISGGASYDDEGDDFIQVQSPGMSRTSFLPTPKAPSALPTMKGRK